LDFRHFWELEIVRLNDRIASSFVLNRDSRFYIEPGHLPVGVIINHAKIKSGPLGFKYQCGSAWWLYVRFQFRNFLFLEPVKPEWCEQKRCDCNEYQNPAGQMKFRLVQRDKSHSSRSEAGQ
jgi:hypothetical protein